MASPPFVVNQKEVSLKLGENSFIGGYMDNVYANMNGDDFTVTTSDNTILPIIRTDPAVIDPLYEGEEYMVFVDAYVQAAAPGEAVLTYYYQGEKLGEIKVTVEAVIAETISDETVLKAKILSDNSGFKFYKDIYKNPAVQLNDIIMSGTNRDWAKEYLFADDILDLLTLNITENGDNLKDVTYYEAVLADILENDTNGIWSKIYSGWKASYGAYTNTIIQKIIGAATDFDDEDAEEVKKGKIRTFLEEHTTEEVVDKVREYADIDENSAFIKGNKEIKLEIDFFDKLGLGVDLVGDFFDAANEAMAYTAVQNEKIAVLRDLQERTENSALAEACENLIKDIEFAHKNVLAYCLANGLWGSFQDLLGFSSGIVTGIVLQYIKIDTGVGTEGEGLTPYLPGIDTAMKIVKSGQFISNTLINADDIAKNVLMVIAYAGLESEIRSALNDAEDTFNSSSTVENAKEFIAWADFFKATLICGSKTALSYVSTVRNTDLNSAVAEDLFPAIISIITGNKNIFLKNINETLVYYGNIEGSIARNIDNIKTEDFYKLSDDVGAYISTIRSTTPSAWAKEYIDEAISKGLVPSYLRGNYQNNITRAEFCTLLYCLLEQSASKTGRSIDDIMGEYPDENVLFKDTYYKYVYYMARLKIVSGVSESEFQPLGEITREQAAIMLKRAADALGIDTSAPATNLAGVSDWARDGVNFVVDRGIMSGTGNGFDPQGKYTKEQAITTMVRFLENL